MVAILCKKVPFLTPKIFIHIGLVCNSGFNEKYKQIAEIVHVDIIP